MFKAIFIFKYCAELGTSFPVLPKAIKHMLVWFNCTTFQLITVFDDKSGSSVNVFRIVTAGKNYPILLMKDNQCQIIVNLIYLTRRQCLTYSSIRYFLKSAGMNSVYWKLLFLICLEENSFANKQPYPIPNEQ